MAHRREKAGFGATGGVGLVAGAGEMAGEAVERAVRLFELIVGRAYSLSLALALELQALTVGYVAKGGDAAVRFIENNVVQGARGNLHPYLASRSMNGTCHDGISLERASLEAGEECLHLGTVVGMDDLDRATAEHGGGIASEHMDSCRRGRTPKCLRGRDGQPCRCRARPVGGNQPRSRLTGLGWRRARRFALQHAARAQRWRRATPSRSGGEGVGHGICRRPRAGDRREPACEWR